jgi:hypothetical protein
VEQSAGCITLYRGMELLHTNTVGRGSEAWRDQPWAKGFPRALGLALVQKSGLYGKRLVAQELLSPTPCYSSGVDGWAKKDTRNFGGLGNL